MANNGKVLINLFGLKQKINVYLEVVNDNLLCAKPVRKRFLRMLKSNIGSFMEENPDATMDDICVAFGDPFDQKNELFEEIEQDYYKRLRKQVIACYVIIAFLLVLLLISISLVGHYFSLSKTSIHFSNIDTLSSFIHYIVLCVAT